VWGRPGRGAQPAQVVAVRLTSEAFDAAAQWNTARCREHHAAAAPRLSGRGPSGPESGGSIARQSPSEPFQPDKGVREVDEQGKADRGSHEVFDHEPILALRMGLADGTDTFLTHLDDSLTPARLRPCARGTRLVA